MSAIAYLISVVWAGVVLPLSLVLLVVADTGSGRAFAVVAAMAGLAPLLAASGWLKRRTNRVRVAAVLAAISLVLVGVLAARAPRGSFAGLAKAKVQHRYAGSDESQFRRFALGNLLPEVDQLRLMFTVMTVIDPLFTQRQAVELKQWTTGIYRELEEDKEFNALGSVMPEVYDEILGLRYDRGHFFLYVPATVDRSKPAPVLVFFHGSGGNFKAYLWLLAGMADRLGMIVIAPSYGMGNWENESGRVEKILDDAVGAISKMVSISPGDIHVMGLSNGGLAVSRLIAGNHAPFRSFVFLSPVFGDGGRIGKGPVGNARAASVFVLTGRDDDRVPFGYVTVQTGKLGAAGARVTMEPVDGANHFLFFSHRARVLASLEGWFRANGVGGTGAQPPR